MKPRHIGVISDTHGLLRAEALRALQGSEMIIHAGDLGDRDVWDRLGQVAPVTAVRGNVDRGLWAEALPLTQTIQVDNHWIHVLHDVNDLGLDPAAAGFRVVISGHSHRPLIETRNGVLFLNPGSAGPRRFDLPITVAVIEILADDVAARLIELSVRG